MRHHRLSMVRGLINGNHPAYFVVDTGGEVISISTATAQALNATPTRKIALKVYGTSGWDREAFLLPGINLKFNDIAYNNFSVVVLNLRAPSVLLGFEVGGIVGHKFLSPYRVSVDLRAQRDADGEGGELAPFQVPTFQVPVRCRVTCASCGEAARPGAACASRHRSSSSGPLRSPAEGPLRLAVLRRATRSQIGVTRQPALSRRRSL